MIEAERFKLGDFVVVACPRADLRKIYLELSSICNLNCPMCFRESMREKKGIMPLEVFERALGGEFPFLKEVVFGGMGEPFVNPKILEMIRVVKKRGLHLRITTNGFLLTDELIDILIDMEVDEIFISCETGDIGHPSVDLVLELLRKISSRRDLLRKGKPVLGVSTVITAENFPDFPFLAREIERAGASSIIISNILPVRREHVSLVLYEENRDEKFLRELILNSVTARLHADVPNFSLKTERYCPFVLNKALVVRWDGEVSPCYRFLYAMEEHFFGRSKLLRSFSFGNVLQESLLKIWMKREYIWFRFKVSWGLFPSCTDCKLREYCNFLEEVRHDCWGNHPTCADCLWWRGIAICP